MADLGSLPVSRLEKKAIMAVLAMWGAIIATVEFAL
jgi:hypothetical protein